MQIISARGINAPVTYQRNFVRFIRVGGPGRGWDNNQFIALVSLHVPEQIPLHLLLMKLLEVAWIQKKVTNPKRLCGENIMKIQAMENLTLGLLYL